MNDRQRLEAIVDVVRSYLPPDGISREEAMSQIIALVDPLPAHPEQEPVAWLDSDGFPWSKEGIECRSVKDTYTPLYAGSPPIKEQQPVAWRYKIVTNCWTYSEEYPNKDLAGDAWERWNVTPLYTAPPSKPWVSLTGDEIDDIAAESGFGYINVARAIEAKLKEKNT